MKHVVIVGCMAAAATAWGQTSAPNGSENAAAAAPAAAYKFVEPRVIADYPLPSKSDPRVCLEFPTQQQIIACANRYLPRRKS